MLFVALFIAYSCLER